jgi:hypothetical protein
MNYDSVDEVYAVNNAVRRDLVARVEGLGEAQVNASEGGWTVAQIVEHLSIVEPRITGAIERMLAAKDGDDRERKLFAPFSLDEYLEQARGKIEAPESLHPTGLPLAEGLIRLKASRATLEALRPKFESADYSQVLKHPAFGMLNAAQWLAFLGMHEQRHLRQIDRILEER